MDCSKDPTGRVFTAAWFSYTEHMLGARRDECVLCGKSKKQVVQLIVGLKGAICNDCVDLCNDILYKGQRPAAPLSSAASSGIVLDADVADLFPTSDAANAGLRLLARAVREAAKDDM
jgi:hypothetical protein